MSSCILQRLDGARPARHPPAGRPKCSDGCSRPTDGACRLIQTLQKQGENPTFSPVVRDYKNFRKLLDGLREGRGNPYE